ncbi:hypothetical protein VNO80_16636 [Phaseolus coccineus]|uniref:Uncharacterized protein n=1 Tax=Phaseolus coccineus TaxID=3886 RepID=A0AAN9MSH6_PHACN
MKPTLTLSINQNSSLDALANDHQIPNPHAGESISIVVHNSSQCGGGVAPEKPCTQNAQTKHETEKAQNGKRRYERKRYMNLPRRAKNRRRAGIEVGSFTELEPMSQARRVANKQSRKEKIIINMEKRPVGMVKQFEAVEGLGVTESERNFCFLPQEYRHTFEEYCLDQSLEELLSDPCIKFAVETITGVKFKTYYFHNIEVEEEGCRKVLSLPENLAIPNECAPTTAEIGETDKGKENSGPSSEMPHDSSCMDPRVEFSVLTLTNGNSGSTIPSDTASNSKSFLQPQLSNAPGH